MTKYRLNERNDFWDIDIEFNDQELLMKVYDAIQNVIKEHYNFGDD